MEAQPERMIVEAPLTVPIEQKQMSSRDVQMQQIALKLRSQFTLMAMLMYLASYLKKFNLFK